MTGTADAGFRIDAFFGVFFAAAVRGVAAGSPRGLANAGAAYAFAVAGTEFTVSVPNTSCIITDLKVLQAWHY